MEVESSTAAPQQVEPVAEKFSVCQGQRGAIETKDVKSGSNIIDKPGSVFVILIDMFEIQPLPETRTNYM